MANPDFSGEVKINIDRRLMLLGSFDLRQKLYNELMDLEQPMRKYTEFETLNTVYEGRVDESRWPLVPTVLG